MADLNEYWKEVENTFSITSKYWINTDHSRYSWHDKKQSDYWRLRNVKTLHDVDDVTLGEELLSQISNADRLEYLMCGDTDGHTEGYTPLHTSAQHNKVEIAELIIRSAPSEKRDSVIYCVNDRDETPLHRAESVDIVNVLLLNVCDDRRQQMIRHVDAWGRTAVHRTARYNRRDLMEVIWQKADEATRQHLLLHRDNNGYNLLLEAGLFGNKDTLNLLLNELSEINIHEEMVTAATSSGDTVIHQLIVYQLVRQVAEILKTLTPDRRKRFLTKKNRNGYSPQQLALIPPRHIRGSVSDPQNYITFNRRCGILEHDISNILLNVIHFLTNEYPITQSGSIIQYHEGTKTLLSHLQLDTQTSTATVSIIDSLNDCLSMLKHLYNSFLYMSRM